mmetsp:Transcript_32388/g.67538  ORF Transcript_32388/g.67538 Transcript_32388/m.67538 type:complete len:510 (-) Transcript_32388:762-2291(-)
MANQRFLDLIKFSREEYQSSRSKKRVAMNIIAQWQHQTPRGRFLQKYKDQKWYEIPQSKILEKTCQALRDLKRERGPGGMRPSTIADRMVDPRGMVGMVTRPSDSRAPVPAVNPAVTPQPTFHPNMTQPYHPLPPHTAMPHHHLPHPWAPPHLAAGMYPHHPPPPYHLNYHGPPIPVHPAPIQGSEIPTSLVGAPPALPPRNGNFGSLGAVNNPTKVDAASKDSGVKDKASSPNEAHIPPKHPPVPHEPAAVAAIQRQASIVAQEMQKMDDMVRRASSTPRSLVPPTLPRDRWSSRPLPLDAGQAAPGKGFAKSPLLASDKNTEKASAGISEAELWGPRPIPGYPIVLTSDKNAEKGSSNTTAPRPYADKPVKAGAVPSPGPAAGGIGVAPTETGKPKEADATKEAAAAALEEKTPKSVATSDAEAEKTAKKGDDAVGKSSKAASDSPKPNDKKAGKEPELQKKGEKPTPAAAKKNGDGKTKNDKNGKGDAHLKGELEAATLLATMFEP